ncbi:MAG: GNAT family N-acetyltransferase [Candidatus Helarchaeota archaeon]
MLKGELLGLVAVEREDLKQLMNWRNNAEFRKHFREYRELSMRHQEIWFEEKVIKDPNTIMFSIRRLEDNELLGCCGFVYINWVHRHADLSLYIGWNDAYIDEEGYAEESCKLLLDYGFKEICLNKVWTEIYEFDEKKKALYDKLGFKQDGLLRQNYWYDGKWWDSRILSLLKEEYLS